MLRAKREKERVSGRGGSRDPVGPGRVLHHFLGPLLDHLFTCFWIPFGDHFGIEFRMFGVFIPSIFGVLVELVLDPRLCDLYVHFSDTSGYILAWVRDTFLELPKP